MRHPLAALAAVLLAACAAAAAEKDENKIVPTGSLGFKLRVFQRPERPSSEKADEEKRNKEEYLQFLDRLKSASTNESRIGIYDRLIDFVESGKVRYNDPPKGMGILALYRRQRGDLLSAEKNYQAAIKDYMEARGFKGPLSAVDRAAADGLDSALLRAYLSQAEAEKYDESSEKIYESALAALPRSAEIYNHRGARRFRGEEYSRAIQDFSRAIELNASCAEAYNNRGLAYARKAAGGMAGTYDEAIADFGAALRIRPSYEEALINRGNVFHQKGDYAKAISDYEQAVKIKQIFGYVCPAVDYAHNKGVIHKDLKPANIMVDRNGFAKVMDFGLASELSGASKTTSVTGTPAYMSPEQHRGRVCRESDIWAMGVCLYEVATGSMPFANSREADILTQKETRMFKKPSRVSAGVPAGIDVLVSRALEPDPSIRLGSAREFLDLLKAC